MYQLIFTNYNNKLVSAVYEEGKMIEVSLDDKETSSIIGNIYVGRVENIVTSINAAFIEISKGIKGYYSLEDNKNHIFLNKKNTDKVCQGDLILVQVEKDAVKTKAPILTSNIELNGRYIALGRETSGINISKKIKDKKLVKAIKNILSEFDCGDYGLVARTNCESLYENEIFDEDLLRNETAQLIDEYHKILQIAPTRTAFSMLYGKNDSFIELVLNTRLENLSEILTDDPDVYNKLILNDSKIKDKIRFYTDELLSLNKLYNVELQIKDALKERVWLKSGGYLVIQPTEALTVIDVNTGKFIAGKDREAGFFKVNCEAAVEIAKQLRLRNYSGIIIVDFIDMKTEEYNNNLMELLNNVVLKDSVKTTVIDKTKLGLVELTRKKVKKPLYEQL